MKKPLIILIPIIVLVVGIYLVFFKKENPEIVVEEVQQEQINPVQISVVETSRQVFEESYEVDFKFPVTGEEKIDDEVTKIVDSLISTFESEALSFSPHPAGVNRKYTLFVSYESKLGDKYDTFVFLVSVDFGGAHPNHFYRTITFDKKQNLVSLEEFLASEFGDVGVINRISNLTREKISEKLGENTNQEMLYAGTEPDFNNFKSFYIDGESIVFLFEPYAVAPYAYSSQEAKISFSDLRI